GDLDVLSASLVGGTVDWYENQGGAAPAFTGRPITGEAAGAFSVSAADVDGDGDLDVLSASRDDDTVAWHENLGGSPPAFATHVVSTAGDGPLSAAATDLDGDGDLDVLSASSLDSTIAWHENQGGGLAVLEPGSALEAGGALKNLGALFASGGTITSAGPFTNDGEAAFSGDCAVHGDLDTSGLLGIEDGTLAVSGDLRATAPPTFTRRVISAAADASSVFAVDLDGDCDTDVLSTSALDDRIALCSNDGEASPRFLSETAFAGDNPVSVFAADLDGNGLPDPLSASYADGTIAWYRKEGASSLSRRVISAAEAGARSVSAADVDGDGDVDVLSASSVGNTISWHENNGASPPAFFAHVIATGAAGARSVAAADLDLDGDADVLSAENADNTVAWYENRGGSPVLFVRHVLSTSVPGASSLPGPASVAAADLDGDGDMDALAAFYSGNTVAWFENDGVSPASFTIRVISAAAAGAHSIHARDLDGDGDEDVLAALHLADSVAWYESDGRAPPAFTERFIGLAEGAYSVFAADVDGDGRIDALSAAADGDTVAWYESSDGGSQGAAAGRRGAITGEGAGGLAIGGTFAAAADTSLLLPSSALSVAVGGDFDAAIDNASRFDMAFAELRLAPSGGETRTLEVMSTDIGPDPAGLDRSLPGHFPLGVLAIGPGTVELVDRRDNDRRGQAACEAVYAGAVEVEAGATLLNDGCKVYYGTLVLDGTASRPENLIPLLSGSSPKLRRGDADSSGVLDISDAVRVLGFLFLGGVTLPCKEAADTDDSGVLDISDAVRILGFLFLGTAPPAPPGAACGPDPQGSPDLGCEEASC
ncbi:MAG: VCBS repeat-containing protein, partial [Planctomycetes bacterium]|nr:VCBS repeat-containing protein [Planctomycetota bacterium]